MKNFMKTMIMLFCLGCHHSMEPWPSEGDRQDVTIYVKTQSLTGITATPSSYQLFIYDGQRTKKHLINTTSKQLQVKLFPGSYTGFCTTYAEAEDYWEYSENSLPADIHLKGQKSRSGCETSNDHLLGECKFEIAEGGQNQMTFDLNRKVSMLKVNIENVPAWLHDLQIKVNNIPKKMNLLGEYSPETYTVMQTITPPDEKGSSITNLLVFPPAQKSELILQSESQNFVTPKYTIHVLKANQITEVKVTFKEPAESLQVHFTTHLVQWEDEINSYDWEVDMPESPCQGEGNGVNLVANAGFEEGFTEAIPISWKFNTGGADKKAVEVTELVYAGKKAIRLEGKTQLYQDIPIAGGQCYQLKMFINAPLTNAKWRYWVTWMNGKTALDLGAMHPTNYRGQTQGYVDAFEGMIMRAPKEATTLRLEIRNYSNLVVDEGLYIDAISVEAIK